MADMRSLAAKRAGDNGMTPQTWAAAVLHGLGIPQTPGAVQALTGWAKAEGGHWNNNARFNPLNTTQPMPGAGNTGSQGNIKVYNSWQQGIDATIQTLRNGRYQPILDALRTGDPSRVASAIGSSPWGTSGSLVAQTISGTPRVAGVHAGAVSAPSAGLPGLQTTMTPTFDQAGFQTAQRRFALGKLLSGQGQMKDNPLFATGLVTTAAPNPQDFTGTRTVTQPAARPAGLSGGYVNPFGSSLVAPGRVDEGVDPTIQGPIRAIGDARVVNISHNFYKGQPYIVYQLTAGPHAGRYVYVSELVTPHVQVGQQVRAGQTIATGHGPIETGWAGGAQGGFMPLANAAQGGSYTEGQATQPGYSFSGLLKRLGANAAR